MNRSLKIFLWALLSILIIGISGAWYASTLINPNYLAQVLSKAVKDSTGRELKINGPVSLKLFPSIGISAKWVSFGNAAWANAGEMLKAKSVELDIELMPLFRKEVAFNAISLNGVDVYLQTNKAGDGNWNFMPIIPASVNVNKHSEMVSSDSAANSIHPIQIKNLTITDARLIYEGFGSTPKSLLIPRFSLHSGHNKTEIVGQTDYGSYQVGIKGKTSNIHELIHGWNVSPVNMPIEVTLTVNGKPIMITGDLAKKPHHQAIFNLSVNSQSFELAPLVASATVAGSMDVSKTSVETAVKTKGRFFFDEDVLPLSVLPKAIGKLDLNIDALSVPGHLPITALKGLFVFDGNKINTNNFTFGLGKGSARIQASLTDFQSPYPVISMKGIAKGFTLEQFMNAIDSKAKVKGGVAEVAFNLRSSGNSMHDLASRATGATQVSIGKSSLDSNFIDGGGDLFITVANAINPMRKKTDQTLLECAVFYLPVSNGQITLNNSIGLVTDRLDVVLSGSIDLKTEVLNIKIDPREKSGLTTGVNLGGLVKLQGTILKPQAGVNREGVVNSAVTIGLGILTSGASILAENAKSMVTKDSAQPCKTALHPWSDIYPGANVLKN